jgi:hypothetical protein
LCAAVCSEHRKALDAVTVATSVAAEAAEEARAPPSPRRTHADDDTRSAPTFFWQIGFATPFSLFFAHSIQASILSKKKTVKRWDEDNENAFFLHLSLPNTF